MPDHVVLIIERPEDPGEREGWARRMLRIQVAMWVDEGASCAACGRPFASVDDFLARDVRSGGPGVFVDGDCWDAWQGPSDA